MPVVPQPSDPALASLRRYSSTISPTFFSEIRRRAPTTTHAARSKRACCHIRCRWLAASAAPPPHFLPSPPPKRLLESSAHLRRGRISAPARSRAASGLAQTRSPATPQSSRTRHAPHQVALTPERRACRRRCDCSSVGVQAACRAAPDAAAPSAPLQSPRRFLRRGSPTGVSAPSDDLVRFHQARTPISTRRLIERICGSPIPGAANAPGHQEFLSQPFVDQPGRAFLTAGVISTPPVFFPVWPAAGLVELRSAPDQFHTPAARCPSPPPAPST